MVKRTHTQTYVKIKQNLHAGKNGKTMLILYGMLSSLSTFYLSSISQIADKCPMVSEFLSFHWLRFSMLHFGTLYGVGHLIAAVLGSLQYGLFAIAEDDLGKDPFWVSLGTVRVKLSG